MTSFPALTEGHSVTLAHARMMFGVVWIYCARTLTLGTSSVSDIMSVFHFNHSLLLTDTDGTE